MRTQSVDTHPEAERVQIGLIRQATVARRFALTRSLSQTTMQLAWRALRRSRPSADEDELRVAFLALHYGHDLAERFRQYLERRLL